MRPQNAYSTHLVPYAFHAITNKLQEFLNTKALLHVLATVHNHLQGVSILKDVYSVIIQLVTIVNCKIYDINTLLQHLRVVLY